MKEINTSFGLFLFFLERYSMQHLKRQMNGDILASYLTCLYTCDHTKKSGYRCDIDGLDTTSCKTIYRWCKYNIPTKRVTEPFVNILLNLLSSNKSYFNTNTYTLNISGNFSIKNKDGHEFSFYESLILEDSEKQKIMLEFQNLIELCDMVEDIKNEDTVNTQYLRLQKYHDWNSFYLFLFEFLFWKFNKIYKYDEENEKNELNRLYHPSFEILKNSKNQFDILSNAIDLKSFDDRMAPNVFDENENEVSDLKELVKSKKKIFIGTEGGAGKSFLTAHLMEELIKENEICVWVFSKTVYSLNCVYHMIDKLFPDEEKIDCPKDLKKNLDSYDIKRLYVFIDGFNESTNQDELKQSIAELIDIEKVNLILTSRYGDPNFNEFYKLKVDAISEENIKRIFGKEYTDLDATVLQLIKRPFFLALAIKNKQNILNVTTAAGLINEEYNRIKSNFGDTTSPNLEALNWFREYVYFDYITPQNKRRLYLDHVESKEKYIDLLSKNRLIIKDEDEKILNFPHEYIRDFMVAKHIYLLLKEAIDKKRQTQVVFNNKFSDVVMKFVGELSGVIKKDNILVQSLDFIGITDADDNSENAAATAAIIKSLALSNNNDLSQLDFSYLDLSESELNNIRTGSDFRSSIIAKKTFVKDVHSSGARTFEIVSLGQKNGRKQLEEKFLVSFGNTDMVIVEPLDLIVKRKISNDNAASDKRVNHYSLSSSDFPTSSASLENTIVVTTHKGNAFLYTIYKDNNSLCSSEKLIYGTVLNDTNSNDKDKALTVLSRDNEYYMLLESGRVLSFDKNCGKIDERFYLGEKALSFCIGKDNFYGLSLSENCIKIQNTKGIVANIEIDNLKENIRLKSAYGSVSQNEFIAFAICNSDDLFLFDLTKNTLKKFNNIEKIQKKDINYIETQRNEILLASESGYVFKFLYDYDGENIVKTGEIKIDRQDLSAEKASFHENENEIYVCSLNRQIIKYSDNFFEKKRLIGNYEGLRKLLNVSGDYQDILVTSYDGCVVFLKKKDDFFYYVKNKVVVSRKSWVWSAIRVDKRHYLFGTDGKIWLYDSNTSEIINSIEVDFRPEAFFIDNDNIYCVGGSRLLKLYISDNENFFDDKGGLKFDEKKTIFSINKIDNNLVVGWSENNDNVAGISFVYKDEKEQTNLISEVYSGRVRDIIPFENYILVVGTNIKNENNETEFFSTIFSFENNKLIKKCKLAGHNGYIVKGAVQKASKSKYLIATCGDDNILNVYEFDCEGENVIEKSHYQHSNKLFDVAFVDNNHIMCTSLSGELISFQIHNQNAETLFMNSSRMLTFGANFTDATIADEELKTVFKYFNNTY